MRVVGHCMGQQVTNMDSQLNCCQNLTLGAIDAIRLAIQTFSIDACKEAALAAVSLRSLPV
jgi:hypothetical protein